MYRRRRKDELEATRASTGRVTAEYNRDDERKSQSRLSLQYMLTDCQKEKSNKKRRYYAMTHIPWYIVLASRSNSVGRFVRKSSDEVDLRGDDGKTSMPNELAEMRSSTEKGLNASILWRCVASEKVGVENGSGGQ